MPKRARAGTVPASSITIKAMSTFGHFHFRWKWGNLKLNIVEIGGLDQRGWGREERLNAGSAAVVRESTFGTGC